MKKTYCCVCTCGLLIALSLPAHAERADREKPIHLEADRMSIDDLNKVQTLDGNVVLTQGTMVIRTNRMVVTQDADGFQKGVATGGANGLARFRQKREGLDEVRGPYISYDALNEKYVVNTGTGIKSATGAPQARVRAIIQPKSKSPPEQKGAPLMLKPAANVNPGVN